MALALVLGIVGQGVQALAQVMDQGTVQVMAMDQEMAMAMDQEMAMALAMVMAMDLDLAMAMALAMVMAMADQALDKEVKKWTVNSDIITIAHSIAWNAISAPVEGASGVITKKQM
jgi:hypothetical protein